MNPAHAAEAICQALRGDDWTEIECGWVEMVIRSVLGRPDSGDTPTPGAPPRATGSIRELLAHAGPLGVRRAPSGAHDRHTPSSPAHAIGPVTSRPPSAPAEDENGGEPP